MPHDLRDALRSLRRAPTFAVVAVLTLSLAIGAAAAVFSVADAVFVRGLPYPDADRLQTIYERSDAGGLRVPSFPTFTDWQAQAPVLRDAIAGLAFVRGDGVLIPGSDGPERKIAAFVTPGFFDLMAVHPMAGRAFSTSDQQPGAPRVAIISFEFFMQRFGGDRSAIGSTVSVDSVPTTIVGIMPRGFAYPNFAGSGGWLPPALWQPIAVFQANKAALTRRGLHVDSRALVRLARHGDSARVAAAFKAVQQHLAEAYPVEQAHWTSIRLQALPEELFGPLSTTLMLIAGAVVLMLALACANVANLMLIRASVGARDMAVRAALGASVWRLARRQFAEVALIAGIAGVIGSWLASIAIGVLKPYASQRLAFAGDIAVDWRTGAFVFALVTVVAAVVGVLPVLQTTRASLIARLRVGAPTQAQGIAERRTRDVLAAVQLALAISVLMGAGLLIQSLRRVSNVDLGYDPNVISFAISPPAHRYDEPAQAAALYKRIIDATGAVPSIDGVAAAGGALLSTKVEIEGQSGGAPPEALYHPVSERYLSVMRIRVTAGRGFTDEDMRTPAGFIITENLARKLWPGSSALGRRITVRRSSQARPDFGQPITLPIIGVVADHRIFGPEADPQMQVFLPYTLEVWPWMTFAVRAPRTVAVAAQVERAIHDVEPAISYLGEKPHVARRGLGPLLTDPRVFVMGLMSVFGFVALLLAAIGLYGIIAYGVAQRTREIGLRLAVGATGRNVVALVMRRAMVLVGIGVVLGIVGGLTASRLVRSMLFETSVMDPATVALAPCLLAVVAVVASAMPAARAAHIDPIVALRGD